MVKMLNYLLSENVFRHGLTVNIFFLIFSFYLKNIINCDWIEELFWNIQLH